MNDEEFAEFYASLSDDERIEFSVNLHEYNKKNKEILNISDEYLAEREERLERFIKFHELRKRALALLHKNQTQLDLVNQRIEARLLDVTETESDIFAGDEPKRRSH